MKPIRVSLKDRSYSIPFGPINKISSAVQNLGFTHGERALLVTSAAVNRVGHVSIVKHALRRCGITPTVVVLPNGEAHKNLDSLKKLFKIGVAAGLDRKSLVIALGGGVVTDVAGFFAATYMRGIPYISIPTTLLGMVDAAIGGKTGVDTPDGKNLVGAFWQPKLVWIDVALLKTLPERELQTGFAEIIKYGVIKDANFFVWLESKIRRNPHFRNWKVEDLTRAIHRSVQIKAMVVGDDEREAPLGGGREILNFGHTGGHALEAAFAYKRLSHGQAISIGMNMAGWIALYCKRWSRDAQLRLITLLEAAGLPTRFPRLNAAQTKTFWRALSKDKKHIAGKLRFVLPIKMGRVAVISGIPLSLVRRAVQETSK